MKRNKKSKNTDPKSINVPNISFSLTDTLDEREKDFKKQRIERGFDDSETWSLRDTIANFIIPRLERYNEITDGMFIRKKEYTDGVQDFLKALKLISRDDGVCMFTDEEEIQVSKGLDAFPKVFMGLWW